MKTQKRIPAFSAPRIEPLETRIAPAFTVSLVAGGGTVLFASDANDDSLVVSVNANGYLTHSLFPTDQRYESATDLDPAAGIQQLQLAAIGLLDIAFATEGTHDITLGDAVASWSFGAVETSVHSVNGGGSDPVTLTIHNSANTSGEVVIFGAGTVAGGAGGGSGKVSFQDLHFLKFEGGSGADQIKIEAASVELKLDGGAGSDEFEVKLGALAQPVTIEDSAGTGDRLEVAGTDKADTITIDERGLTGMSEWISFSPASGLERLSVDGGSGADEINVVKLNVAQTGVLGGAGDDLIQFLKHATASVDGGGDSDTILIKFIQSEPAARVTVHDTGADGYDVIKLEGSALGDDISGIKGELQFHKGGDTSAAALAIKFDGIEGESVTGGDGADRFVIKGSTGDLQLDGGTGDDYYEIKLDGSPQQITLEPSPGGFGTPESDTLTVLGTDRADRFAFQADRIEDGNGAFIKFDGVIGSCVTGIKLDGAKGHDRFFIDAGTPLFIAGFAVHTDVFGGSGNDSVTIVSVPGTFSVDGGIGSDTVAVELASVTSSGILTDSGRTGTDRLFILGTSRGDSFRVDGSDPAGILIGLNKAPNALQFLKFEGFTIDGGAGDDEALFYTVKLSGLSGRFEGGLGHDRVTLRGDHDLHSLILDGGEGGDEYLWEAGGIKGLIRIADSGSGDDDMADDGDSLTLLGTPQKDVIKFGGGSAGIGESRLSYGKLEFIKIDGAAGDDLITVRGNAADCNDLEILGGDGNDTIINFLKLNAAAPNDFATLLLPAVQKVALEGADYGGGPHVRILGGADNDILIGGPGNEAFDGGAGNDTIKAGGGNDRITGGAGTNAIDGGGGADTIVEGADTDFIFHKGTLTADHKGELKFDGTDSLVGVEAFEVTGGDGGRTFDFSGFNGRVAARGGAGDDEFLGGAGNDSFSGGLGNDKFHGGAGYNEVSEEGDVDFAVTGDGRTGMLTGLGEDTLTNIALITLTGGGSANLLDGIKWSGDLILAGGGGDDELFGGTGGNAFLGGDGDDMITGQGVKNLLVETGDVDFTLANGALTGRGTDALSGIYAAILIGGESDNVIDALQFSGTVQLAGLDGDDHLTGALGKTILLGNDGDDVLSGIAKVTKFVGGLGKNKILKILTPI